MQNARDKTGTPPLAVPEEPNASTAAFQLMPIPVRGQSSPAAHLCSNSPVQMSDERNLSPTLSSCFCARG